ncbi:hypothetical protein [Microbulbifer sp. DLAB2-AA]|uniref:hypothetical protein n=1 Tax=Microbulbifer sp. DLAB2-AA TaxID=3243394 RepID=UPI00403A0EE2
MDEFELGTKIIRTAVVTIAFFLISAFIFWRVIKPLKRFDGGVPERKVPYDHKMKAYENAVLLIHGLESKLNRLLTEFEKIRKGDSSDRKVTKSKEAFITRFNKVDDKLEKLALHFGPEVHRLIEDLRKSTKLAAQSVGILDKDQEHFQRLQKKLAALLEVIFRDGQNHYNTLSTSAAN